MLRVISTLSAATIIASIGVMAVQFRDPPATTACSGGMVFGFAVLHARAIVVGEAVSVGDAINRAPTLTPSSTPTSTPTPTRTPIFPRGTVEGDLTTTTPPSAFDESLTPPGFSLEGYGVVIHVERICGGSRGIVDEYGNVTIDGDVRASIERDLRQLESGHGLIGTCGVGDFVPKFELGERYLIIADDLNYPNSGLWTGYRLRLEGDYAVLNDPAYARFGNQSPISTTVDRMPINAVLRLAADIKGAPPIIPPETGTAGLAAGRAP